MTFFSVIIPVFNRVEPLRRAIESVLIQDYSDFEIIVVDDGSDIEHAKAIQSMIDGFQSDSLKLIRYKQNVNGAYARNMGIKAAEGDYICLLDSDDAWHQNKLAEVNQHIALSGAEFLYHQCELESGVAIPANGIKENESYSEYTFVRNQRVGAPTSTIVLARKLALQHLFDETLAGHQDWDFCFNLEAAGVEFYFIPKVLSKRYQSNIDSVGNSICFDYSLTFFRQRKRYFSLKSAIYFHWLTLLPKAIKEFRIADGFRTSLYFWLMLLTPNLAIHKDLISGLTKNWALQRRINKVCRLTKYLDDNVFIYGDNYYAQLLNQAMDAKVAGFTATKPSRKTYLDKPLLPVEKLLIDDKILITAIVLATDKHHHAMTAEIMKRAPNLRAKIIHF
jgi:amylovoran biosynthesis glycosyltransferase AmsB